MLRIKQAIIVEGRYDKIRLSNITDAVVICTNGFSIYKDREKQELIKSLAAKTGIIILTDSDSAGFTIRNYIVNLVGAKNVVNAYVPDIKGKEKRKAVPSSEGYLGVEGLDTEILESALKKAGLATEGDTAYKKHDFLTKSDMMDDGMIGCANSSQLRRDVLLALGLPPILSANTMLEVINRLYTKEEYENAVRTAFENKK